MAQNEESGSATEGEGTVAVITVPEELAQQVLDYVNSLSGSSDDVSGHAFSRAGSLGGSMGSVFAAKGWTGTQCQQTQTGLFSMDMSCSDTDEIVTK